MSYQEKNKTNESWCSYVNLLLRSFIFWLYAALSIFFYSFFCLLMLPFPLRYRHGVIRAYLRFYFVVLKAICHIDYKIEGLENIPQDRTGVILCKHQSTWETFFLPIIFHEPAIILKRELLWIPFFGWGLAVCDPIAIDRKNKNSAMQQIIKKGQQCLDEGRWVLVFPEGTRIPYGSVGHYKLGGARLAVETGYPVLPIAHNAGRFWPKRQFIKRPGTVTMVIGPLIETKGLGPEAVLTLAKNWIEGTVRRIDSGVDESTR